MTVQERLIQTAVILWYPLVSMIIITAWAAYRIIRTTLPRMQKLTKIAYILLLGLCVFPLSFYLFLSYSELCYGAGSGLFNASHQLLCSHEVVLGMPWWGVVLYSVDILILWWGARRSLKSPQGNRIISFMPLIYFFVIRIAILTLLEVIENTYLLPI
jgi:hypothetical protein